MLAVSRAHMQMFRIVNIKPECSPVTQVARVRFPVKTLHKLLFLSFPANHKYNCALIKVNWLAACIAPRVFGAVFPPAFAYNLHSPPVSGKQG
jgi:hypothetical protein